MANIEQRLQNTEKALFALVSVLMPIQPPDTQESINMIMNDYFEANTSLGFDSSNADFIKHVDASYVKQGA